MKLWINPSLALLSSTLVLAVVWDMGYRVWSLESLFALATALLVGVGLSVLTAFSPALRMGAVGFLFFSLIDIFFIQSEWYACTLLVLGILAMVLLHKRLQINFFVVSGLVFVIGIYFKNFEMSNPNQTAPIISSNAPDQILVHFVMDELGAFESVPEAFRIQADIDEINQAYARRGFRLYNNHLSISPDTFESLSSMVNIDPALQGQSNAVKLQGEDSYRINQNSLHELFVDKQWNVSIRQSNYLNFCASKRFNCQTYDIGNNAYVYGDAGLSWSDRGGIFYRELLATLMRKPRDSIWITGISRLLPQMEEWLSIKSWRRPTLPLAMMNQLDQQVEAIRSMKGKHYVFTHLLLPHFPWTLGRDCHAMPVNQWRLPYKARTNMIPGERQAALEAYWRQTYCTHKRLLETIDQLDAAHPERLRFLIHGDHGPRILARHLPKNSSGVILEEQTRRNLLEPFIASRLQAGGDLDLSTASQMQDIVQKLLMHEADVNSYGKLR